MSQEFRIDLPVVNEWENVERVREMVLACFTAMFASPSVTWHAFATVASELTENAIKYGKWNGRGHLMLRLSGDAERVRIEVSHPVESGSEHVRELMATLSWLRGFTSPEDAYRERMRAAAAGPSGVSKLGLARIAYETQCELSAELQDGRISVRGVARIHP